MPRVLVTGASGQLGAYLLRHLAARAITAVGWSGSRTGALFGIPLRPVDLGNVDALSSAFRETRPEVILHAGAMARLSDCHRQPELAHRVNAAGTAILANLALEARAHLLFVSTDLVFDGTRGGYTEEDVPCPLSVYGRTKVEAEKSVLEAGGLVVRVSLLFGPSLNGKPSFFSEQRDALRSGRPVSLFADEWRTPLALTTAARSLCELALSDHTGLLHLGGPERLARVEMGQVLAGAIGVDPSLIREVRRADLPAPEPRPRDTSLDSSRWRELFPAAPWPGYREALTEMLRETLQDNG
jgi:dTDP-4-dehydrorhamnose reductase